MNSCMGCKWIDSELVLQKCNYCIRGGSVFDRYEPIQPPRPELPEKCDHEWHRTTSPNIAGKDKYAGDLCVKCFEWKSPDVPRKSSEKDINYEVGEVQSVLLKINKIIDCLNWLYGEIGKQGKDK